MDDITDFLKQAAAGNKEAIDRAMPLVAEELHSLAEKHMRGERSGHTLQPTALVNEAYLRLVGEGPVGYRDRNHFFAIASKKMREILINHAHRRDAQKRGGGRPMLQLDPSVPAPEKGFAQLDLIALDEALKRLEGRGDERCKRMARIVEMRLFGGMGTREIADTLARSERSVERELKVATMVILEDLRSEAGHG